MPAFHVPCRHNAGPSSIVVVKGFCGKLNNTTCAICLETKKHQSSQNGAPKKGGGENARVRVKNSEGAKRFSRMLLQLAAAGG